MVSTTTGDESTGALSIIFGVSTTATGQDIYLGASTTLGVSTTLGAAGTLSTATGAALTASI